MTHDDAITRRRLLRHGMAGLGTTVAGAALTGFSGGLMGLYWNTPGLRKPGTPWPTQDGLGVSKDVWMLGIGVGLLLDGLTRGAKKSAKHTAKKVLPSS